MKISSTKNLATFNGVKAIVYGQSGMGKTMLSATCPAPIIVSAESGLLSLQEKNLISVFGENTPGINYNIPVIEISNSNDIKDALDFFKFSAESKNYYTVYLDSLSEIGEVVLSHFKQKTNDGRLAYMKMYDEMEQIIKDFRNLQQRNVVMTSKIQDVKDDLTGIVKYGPTIPGKQMASNLPYYFDEVFRLGIYTDSENKNQRIIQTQPDLQYVCKDRSGMLDMYEYPNLLQIFNKIYGV